MNAEKIKWRCYEHGRNYVISCSFMIDGTTCGIDSFISKMGLECARSVNGLIICEISKIIDDIEDFVATFEVEGNGDVRP